jgi:outer membrane protein
MRIHCLFILAAFTTFTAIPVAGQTIQKLDLKLAESIAIANHPQIQAATHLASAAQAQVTQARAAYYPVAYGSLTGADAEHNSRIAAGLLNNPIVFNRYANGVEVNKLITDFGRTHGAGEELRFPRQGAEGKYRHHARGCSARG